LAQSCKKEKKRYVSVILRILVATGALYLVFRGEDLRELADIMLGLNLWLFAAALGLYWLGQAFFVLRWRLLLKVQSVDISIWAGMKLHLLGLFYNNCLPSSIGGDLLRAWYVTKHTDGDRRVGAALTVFVDRIVGLIGTLLIASIAYWLVPVEGGYMPEGQAGAEANGGLIRYLVEHRWIFIWAAIAVGVGFCAVWVTQRGREVLTACWQRVWRVTVRILKKGITAMGLYQRKPFVLVCALGLTFICQGTCVIAFWLLGRNLGMGAHIKYYFVFFPLFVDSGIIADKHWGCGYNGGLAEDNVYETARCQQQRSAGSGPLPAADMVDWVYSGIGGSPCGSTSSEGKSGFFC